MNNGKAEENRSGSLASEEERSRVKGDNSKDPC
eukprot:CAMPEP_0170528520 /NCGR_PEP_ID=MMETSP0209-20121228/14035_1 /TAXON_ID=665100 ORGANISM="Litonotus pictus, Strain P1" /NCGR_SAMPLE_ID=MMETSP0209 /ASSEMBLY_ACC=CAM_ASM_000301 /LENGTH=32 /DNA_ID= /DNA_START= /DNA_END= /DNA_ORIENTATION=